MAESLAELRQKGGNGIESNLFSVSPLLAGVTSWETLTMASSVNDPNGSANTTVLDPDFGHFANNGIVVDKAIPKAYISGGAYRTRNSSGVVYRSLRVLKNGTVISGTSVTGNSSSPDVYFRRVQESFAVGDVITIQFKASATSNWYFGAGNVNIVTDD